MDLFFLSRVFEFEFQLDVVGISLWAYVLAVWCGRMVWAYGLDVWSGRMFWAYVLGV